MAPPPEVKVLRAMDGTIIYADAVGDSRNPSIVFVHGFALSGIVFDGLFSDPRLVNNLYLVRYDMRGHGRSGKPTGPESYSSSLYANDFKTVAEAFSLVNPILAGWSLGAAVAADISSNMSPSAISGVVAIGGAPCMGPITASTMTTALLELIPRFSSTTNVAQALTARTDFVDSLFFDPSHLPFDVKSRWLGNTVLQTPEVTAALQYRRTDEAKLFELGVQGLPLLVLHGREDKLVDGEAVVALLKPYFKDMEVRLLDNSGHAVFYDSHADTVDILINFSRRVSLKAETSR